MQHVEGEEGNLEDLIPSQIHQSITSSLNNLSTPSEPPYLDALILHSPFPTQAQTQLAWRCLQQYLPSSSSPDLAGKILRLGISNAPLGSITALDPAPSIVQNRFHAVERRWDTQVRAWCRARREFDRAEAYYQAFWTLTANPDVWRGPDAKWFVRELAQHAGVSPAAAWYVLLMDGAGLVVLNGTSNSTHMRDDLEARAKVAAWAATEEGREPWIRCVEGFKEMVWR
jgi:diketogulonate reductase-like aldo/keto reductase